MKMESKRNLVNVRLLAFVLVIYFIINKLTFVFFKFTIFPFPKKIYQKEIKAYVLTVSEDRWVSASSLLSRADLKPIRLVPIPLDASVIVLDGGFNKPEKNKYRKYHNNKLSHVRFWRQIAYDSSLDIEDGYSLVFEDDIALHPSVDVSDVRAIIEHTAKLSRDAGVFFLGLCAPGCRNSVGKNQILYSECIGQCSHASGVFKWKAEWLYEELVAVVGDSFPEDHYVHSIDKYFVYGFPGLLKDGPWPYLAGANLSSEVLDQNGKTLDSHKGIFFQDRKTFQSDADPAVN